MKTGQTRRAFIVTLTASLFFFYQFFQLNFFNVINLSLRTTFHLDALQLGQLFALYFYANFIFLFPAGSLIDRFSPRNILIIALLVTISGTLLFAVATEYWMAAMGRLMVGAAAAFCFLSCMRIASRWFLPQQMALATGMIVAMAMLGGLVAQAPFSALTTYLGSWRYAMLVNVLLGVVILLLVCMIVSDYPPESREAVDDASKELQRLGLLRSLKLAASSLQTWAGGLYTACMNIPVFLLGGLWGALYLKQVHHLNDNQAAYATSLFFLGVMVGSPLYGLVSDRLENRILPMAAGAVLLLVLLCVLMFVSTLSFLSLAIFFFLIGLMTSAQALSYPLIGESSPAYLASTAFGILSLSSMASGFIVPALFGWLMQSGKEPGVTVYLAADFDRAMFVFPVFILLALVMTFFMRETHCKSQ